MEKPETLVTKFDEPADVIVFDRFKDLGEARCANSTIPSALP